MLGPGKYVFKNGYEQFGEYVLEQNNQRENGNTNSEFITEWRCKTKQGYV